jgi:hypothetical protein
LVLERERGGKLYAAALLTLGRSRIVSSHARVRALRRIGDLVWLEVAQEVVSGSESGPDTETIRWLAWIYDASGSCRVARIPIRDEERDLRGESPRRVKLQQIDVDLEGAVLTIRKRTSSVSEQQTAWLGSHPLR